MALAASLVCWVENTRCLCQSGLHRNIPGSTGFCGSINASEQDENIFDLFPGIAVILCSVVFFKF